MKTDRELQEDVINELLWDPKLADIASKIGVSASRGMVTLSGEVDTYSQKIAAEHAAQRVHGVNVVALDIEVHALPSFAKSDIEIAKMINSAIQWNSLIQNEQIEVMVENGWVTLTGAVSWHFERRAVEAAVKNITGVKGIINNITLIASELDSRVIKDKISAAFHRSATIDSASIQVEVNKKSVILRGSVKSRKDKKDAEKAAWSSPGVTSVENRLIVELSPQLA